MIVCSYPKLKFEGEYMKKSTSLATKILCGVASVCVLIGAGIWSYTYSSEPVKKSNASLEISNEKVISTDLVLYENGRGFVSQTRKVKLPKGLQEINFGKVPKTLVLSSAAVSGKDIISQSMNFDPRFDNKTYYEVSQEEAIGKEVTLLWTVWKEGEKKEIKQKAKLLAVENGVPVLLIDGMVHKGTDARILYPALNKKIKNKNEALDFTVVSQTDKEQEITFSYLAEGFNWGTNYNVYLDEEKNQMTLKGYVQLKNNSFLDYTDANIDFVLGEINTIREGLPSHQERATCQIDNKSGLKVSTEPITVNGKRFVTSSDEEHIDSYLNGETAYVLKNGRMVDMDGRVMSINGKVINLGAEVLDLKDYFVYRLPFKSNLKQGQPLTALFLDKENLSYQKEYVFNNPVVLRQTTDTKNIAPQLQIIFQNDADSGIGMPLPKGTFHVFNKKGKGAFFVGESSVYKTITLGQKATIKIGDALDVYANVKQTAYREVSDEVSEYTYEVEIRNISKENKKVNIEEDVFTGLDFKESSLEPTENLPHKVSWSLDIPANTTKSFTFSIQYTDLD